MDLRAFPVSVTLVVVTFGLGLSCTSPPEEATEGPGYASRACGFDLDDDGRVGESDDDCRVCDGETTDPDGDGVDERLLYVDCGRGVDDASCGAPDRPCRTVTWAWTRRAADAAADPDADARAETIVCFRGTCAPDVLTPSVGGAPAGDPAWREVPPSGRQAATFRVATDPTMLVGWDADGDGAYPPHDADDEAVLDGGGDPSIAGDGLTRAIWLGDGNSGLEMAHFTVRDYGRDTDVERSGFVHFGRRGDDRLELVQIHDLSLQSVNREQPAQGHRIVFNLFMGGTRVHDVAVTNLEILDTSGFMVRGAGPDLGRGAAGSGAEERDGARDDGPFRFERLTVTADGCDQSDEACRQRGGSAFIGWKLWGYIDGVEVLDSIFDAQLTEGAEAWEPKPAGNGGALLVNATQCSRGWTVRGNIVRDFKVGFLAQGGDGRFCAYDVENDPPQSLPRPTTAFVVEDNLFVNRYRPWRSGDVAIHLKGGDDVRRTLGDARIARNTVLSSDGFDACILVDVRHRGGDAPGTVEIVDNACWGSRAEGESVGLRIGLGPRERKPFVGGADEIDPALGEAVGGQEDLILRGNLVAGLDEEDVALWLDEIPERLDASGNRLDPDAELRVLEQRPRSVDALEEAVGQNLGEALAGEPCVAARGADGTPDLEACAEILRTLVADGA